MHCGWARLLPDGSVGIGSFAPDLPDLFPVLASDCAFAVHACMLRKTCWKEAGGFDTSLATCEDWDLWQRIARRGARLGRVSKVLAHYRMRARSLSNDGIQMLGDGLLVLRRGHGIDDRVPSSASVHREGMPTQPLGDREFHGRRTGGLSVGAGIDPRAALSRLHGNAPAIDPLGLAMNLLRPSRCRHAPLRETRGGCGRPSRR